jgi:hypothetical protein
VEELINFATEGQDDLRRLRLQHAAGPDGNPDSNSGTYVEFFLARSLLIFE